jgi:hypothetical protein
MVEDYLAGEFTYPSTAADAPLTRPLRAGCRSSRAPLGAYAASNVR